MAAVRIPLGIALLTTVIGVSFVAAGIWSFYEQRRIARTWLSVEADVSDARIYDYLRKQTRYYRGEIELSFRAEGEDRRIPYTFRSSSTSRNSVQSALEEFTRNRRRTIYYDPADPNRILLDISGFGFYALPAVFTSAGAVVSAVALWLWRLKLRYQPLRCRQCDTVLGEGHLYCFNCGKGVEHARKKKRGLLPPVARRQGDTRAFLYVAIFFGIGGLAVMAVGQNMARRQMEVRRAWPETEAEVVRTEISRRRGMEARPTFRVKPTFRYRADGQEYVSSAISEYDLMTYADAERERRQYPAGSRHRIHYNPAHPGDVQFEVEQRGFMGASLAVTLFGAIFASIALALLFQWIYSRIRCRTCSQTVSRKWRYCAYCGADAPTQPAGAHAAQ